MTDISLEIMNFALFFNSLKVWPHGHLSRSEKDGRTATPQRAADDTV